MPGNLALGQTYDSIHGTVAYDVIGHGEPLILIHGTPSSTYLWRNVVDALRDDWAIHVFDLVGFGQSEKFEGQDVSLKAQAEVFSELLDYWALQSPNVVGHDYGAATALRALLLDGQQFRSVAVFDGVVREPWVTPFSQHVREHVEVFQTVPEHIHRQLLIGHLRSAIHKEMSESDLEPYLSPWLGEVGQPAYYRQVAQFDEQYTGEIESEYPSISIPTLVAWGDQDEWIDIEVGRWLRDEIPDSQFRIIPDSGHFSPEDAPEAVASTLERFLDTHV